MNSKLNKAYTTFLVLSLILDAYAFNFLPSMSLSYIGLVIFMILFIIRKNKDDKKIVVGPLVLVGLLILESVVNIIISTNQSLFTTKFVISSIKMIVWALSVAYTSKYIIKDRFVNQSVKLSVIATLYLILQTIMYYIFAVKLPNGFNLGLIKYVGVDISSFISTYRPASFFAEPSYYSAFIVLTLCFILFIRRNNKKSTILFLSLGIILSTSSAGMYLLGILFAIYIINSSRKNARKLIIFLIIVLPIVLFVYFNYISILNNLGSVGQATLKAINKVNNYENSSRLGGSFKYIGQLDGKEKIVGYGIGNEYIMFNNKITYLNSITRLFLQSGTVGIILFGTYIVVILKGIKNPAGLFIAIMYIIKSLTSGAMFAVGGFYILSLYYLANDSKINEE